MNLEIAMTSTFLILCAVSVAVSLATAISMWMYTRKQQAEMSDLRKENMQLHIEVQHQKNQLEIMHGQYLELLERLARK